MDILKHHKTSSVLGCEQGGGLELQLVISNNSNIHMRIQIFVYTCAYIYDNMSNLYSTYNDNRIQRDFSVIRINTLRIHVCQHLHIIAYDEIYPSFLYTNYSQFSISVYQPFFIYTIFFDNILQCLSRFTIFRNLVGRKLMEWFLTHL